MFMVRWEGTSDLRQSHRLRSQTAMFRAGLKTWRMNCGAQTAWSLTLLGLEGVQSSTVS